MIERILANCEGGMDLRDQAAVFRTSHEASQLGVELVRRNIPFVKFGGLKFLEAAHVKDVLAVLRWGENPRDLATGTPEEIDEERRLLYVAMTRARDDLVLMQPLRFFMRGQARGGDAHVFAPRSRFIAACDLDAFELIGGHISCGAENGMAGRPVANIDLKTRMREIWR